MIKLMINGEALDVPADLSISEKKVNNMFNFGDLELSRSASFTLPKTPRNVQILDNCGSVLKTGEVMRHRVAGVYVFNTVQQEVEILVSSADDDGFQCSLFLGNLSKLAMLVGSEKLLTQYIDMSNSVSKGSRAVTQENARKTLFAKIKYYQVWRSLEKDPDTGEMVPSEAVDPYLPSVNLGKLADRVYEGATGRHLPQSVYDEDEGDVVDGVGYNLRILPRSVGQEWLVGGQRPAVGRNSLKLTVEVRGRVSDHDDPWSPSTEILCTKNGSLIPESVTILNDVYAKWDDFLVRAYDMRNEETASVAAFRCHGTVKFRIGEDFPSGWVMLHYLGVNDDEPDTQTFGSDCWFNDIKGHRHYIAWGADFGHDEHIVGTPVGRSFTFPAGTIFGFVPFNLLYGTEMDWDRPHEEQHLFHVEQVKEEERNIKPITFTIDLATHHAGETEWSYFLWDMLPMDWTVWNLFRILRDCTRTLLCTDNLLSYESGDDVDEWDVFFLDRVVKVEKTKRTFLNFAQKTKFEFNGEAVEDEEKIATYYAINNETLSDETTANTAPISEGGTTEWYQEQEDIWRYLYLRNDEDTSAMETITVAQTFDAPKIYLRRIQTPRNSLIDRLCNISTQCTVTVVMNYYDFYHLKQKQLIQLHGVRYVWTEAQWNDGTVKLTLQKV